MYAKFVKLSLSGLGLLTLLLAGGPVVHAEHVLDNGQSVGVQDTYSQLGGGTGTIKSQRFASGTTTFTKVAADIQVPSGPWWLVNQVTVPGTLTLGQGITLQNVTVEFYVDSASKPGTNHSSPIVLSSGLISGNSVLNIPTVALPPNRTYWMSVQATFSNYTPGIQFFTEWNWSTRSQAGSNLGAETGSSPGCDMWNVPWDNCGSSTQHPVERDVQFSLTYTPFTPTAFIYLPVIRR